MSDASGWTWMSDDALEDPATEPRAKYFGRESFVSSMAEVIRRAQLQSPSLVFGLIGPWGSGKSTIITSLRKELSKEVEEHKVWRIREFNPWLYSDQVSLQFGFFNELRDALPTGKRWTDTRGNLNKLRDVVTPIAQAASLIGPNVLPIADSLLDTTRISAFKVRNKIARHLAELEQPILIVLDDLDRLTATELLEVFKLVRFVGRLPNVHYLLCYDEKTLVDMLDQTDLVGAAEDRRSLDYLEKIVQIRFDIPPVRRELVEELFVEAVRALLKANRIDEVDADGHRMRRAYDAGFGGRLTTPRAVKHLLGQIEAFLPNVGQEVDWVDFVLVSWIRTFEPGLYSLLAHEKDLLLGRSQMAIYDKKKAAQIRIEELERLLQLARVAGPSKSSTLDVLQELFPVVKRIRDGGAPDHRSEVKGRRIAHADYFDRYFEFGVPRDDLPNATVRTGLADMPDGNSSALASVALQLREEPGRTIRKLTAERDRGPEPSLALANWLLSEYPRLPFWASHQSPADQVLYFLPRVLVDLNENDAINFTNLAMSLSTTTAFLVSDAVRHLRGMEVGSMSEVREWNSRGEALGSVVEARIEATLDSFTSGRGVFDLDIDTWRLLWHWDILAPGQPKRYLKKRQTTDGWSTLDLLARYVTSTVPAGSTEILGTIDGFDPREVSKFLDVAAAYVELATQVSEAGLPAGRHESLATPENRRAYVLAWMKQHPDDSQVAGKDG